MENKISAIEEKLCELKIAVAVPDYNGLLSKFEWSREWFAQAENALLALAFRGESDRPILDFIRAKIIGTDIITFNKILKSFGATPITNHYEMIAKTVAGVKQLLIECNNSKVIDALCKEYLSVDFLSKMRGSKLSVSENDIAVDYLIAHPDKINWDEFVFNRNIKAVKYYMENKQIDSYALSSADNDEIIRYLFANPNLINYEALSANPNELAVDHLLANPQKIQIHSFHLNTNPRAVEYLLERPDIINWEQLAFNSNDKAVEYVLNNRTGSNRHILCENENDKVVEFLISNPKLIDWQEFYSNPNDKATEYSLTKLKPKHLQYMYANNCNYNMQKLREFNKLGLFPHIQYLVI
jgi:hypothetical protein